MNGKTVFLAIVAIAAAVAAVLAVRYLAEGNGVEGGAPVSTDAGQDDVRGAQEPAANGDEAGAQPVDAESALVAELAIAAREASAAAPLAIDELTTMTGARAIGTTFEYRYRLARALTPEQSARARDAISVQIATRVCQQPDVRGMIERGAELRYAYHGPDGELLFRTPAIVCRSTPG